MSALQKRLERLECTSGVMWVCVSAPESWPFSKMESEGKRLAAERGYRGPSVVIPFTDPVETEAEILDISDDFTGVLQLFNVIAQQGQQKRIERQKQRAEKEARND